MCQIHWHSAPWPTSWSTKGEAWKRKKRRRRALELNPADAESYNVLGLALRAHALTPLPYGEPVTDAQGDILLQAQRPVGASHQDVRYRDADETGSGRCLRQPWQPRLPI